MVGITTQQQLILEQQRRLCDTIDQTGIHLDNKAATILQAGGLIVAITGATVLPSAINNQPQLLWGVAAGFLIFIAMIITAIAAWRPQGHLLVGNGADWDSFFDDYISRDVEDAYGTVLKNLLDATIANQAANHRKARYVNIAAWLFAGQVTAILILSVAVAFSR
jgi:hypothetical protein